MEAAQFDCRSAEAAQSDNQIADAEKFDYRSVEAGWGCGCQSVEVVSASTEWSLSFVLHPALILIGPIKVRYLRS